MGFGQYLCTVVMMAGSQSCEEETAGDVRSGADIDSDWVFRDYEDV